MKYYGITYHDFKSVHTSNGNLYDSEYHALAAANKKWDKHINADGSIPRLLVVISEDSTKQAFFDFKDSQSCEQFVEQKSQIVFSPSFEDPYWNGNGGHM